jgi:hypothetical protein
LAATKSLHTMLNTITACVRPLFLILAAVALLPAQVSSSGQIVGTVQDASGAAVPGVELALKSTSTGNSQTATAAANGGFVFNTLPPGLYQLSASAKGFEKAVYDGIVVNTARTTDQLVVMKVGAVSETVEVSGAAPVLQTSSTTISNTVDQKALQDLPLTGRDTLPFALLSAGAQQGVTSRDSTFEGMPGGSINITLNGIANNAQRFKSGGTSFFAFVTPRLETVQEVTVSTSNLGADSTGQGAMQVQYVSKSGSNSFHGEAFWQHSNSALNANDWFNNANSIKRPVYIQNDQGGTIGGPVLKNRLFFFFSYAERITPSSGQYSATVLNSSAQAGNFSYVGTDNITHSVNLLALAGRNGFPSTVNPIIGAQLQKIQAATSSGALSPSDLIRNQLVWTAPQPETDYYPMGRMDWLITPNLRFNVSDTWSRNVNAPGFRGTTLPGSFQREQSYGQVANPYIATAGLTWTIKPNLVNDFNFGIQGTQETFNTGFNLSTFQPNLLTFPLGLASGLEEMNGLQEGNAFEARNNPVDNLFDNLKWEKGNHSISFGGNWIRSYMHDSNLNSAGIPSYTFGVNSADPVNAIFNAANLPAISSVNLQDATNLYALLTGRVNSVTINRNLNSATHQYANYQPVFTNELMTSFGLYVADSWRVTRNLTVNYGLRWDFQGDNENPNNVYTSPTPADLFGPSGSIGGANSITPNLFNPGSLQGVANPSIYQRSKAYNADFMNPAPHIGLAWNPNTQHGLLGSMLGDKKTVFRAGYSLSYYSEGMLSFTDLVGSNPGTTQTATVSPGVNFAPGSLSIGNPLPAATGFPQSFSFPLPLSNFAFNNQTVGSIDPNIKAPYVQTWSASIQREIKSGTVLEVRYAGNHGVNLWHAYNVNEVNIFENGFLNQFQAAQQNLAVNQASGRGATFANNGLPGQAATPIFNSAFGGLPAAQGFANTNFVNLLQSGQAGALANNLAQTPSYFCNMVGNKFSPCASRGSTTPGAYPINFFQLNPYVQTANLLSSDSYSNYNSLQVELRQRVWHGLTYNANYTYSHSLTDRYSKSVDNIQNYTTLRDRNLNKGPSPFDLRHVLQVYGTYDIPFGKGRTFSVNNRLVEAVAGGWTLGSIFRAQTGLPFELSSGQLTVNQQDSGVVANVNASTLQSNVGTYKTGNPYVYFLNPQTIGSDGRANSKFLALPTTAGQFGSNIFLYGPHFISDDLSIAKSVAILERLKMEIRAEMVNAFNHPIFQVPTGGTFGINGIDIAATTFGRATATTTMPRQVQFRIRFAF